MDLLRKLFMLNNLQVLNKRNFQTMFLNLNALYGLKQAPRAWYDRLKSFLLNSDFKMGRADTTFFIKHVNNDILIIQIYVDDILFGSTNDNLCQEFSKTMQSEFEMSHMGELTFSVCK